MKIKIAIIDDHPLALSGISNMLSDFEHLAIINTYLSATALLEGFKERQPDILLLDIMLPDKSGRELLPVLIKTYPELKIVVLTSFDAPSMVKSMMANGCIGYLLKGADQQTLIEGIEHAYRGEEYIDPALRDHLLQNMTGSKQRGSNTSLILTKREKEILLMVIAGDTTQQMADKLFISARTAERHRLNLLQKLEAKNSASLVLKAIQLGLINMQGM